MTIYESARPVLSSSADGVQKFGRGTVGTSQVAVWDHGGVHTFNDTAVAYYLSSSNNGDDDDITCEVIDGNGASSKITTALTGQTQVRIGTGTYVRCYRAFVDDSTEPAGDVYVAESDDLTSGVPDTQTKVKAKITQGYNQTQMAIWHLAASKRGRVTRAYVSGSTNGKVVTACLWRKPWGKVARVQHEIILKDVPVLIPFSRSLSVTARDDWYMTAAVGTGTGTVDAGFDVDVWPL